MKILVVDDEKLLVKGITFNLANEGYEVTAAYDGEAAVELAKKENFDLIILDLMMPVLSGTEACMKIREFSDVPISLSASSLRAVSMMMGPGSAGQVRSDRLLPPAPENQRQRPSASQPQCGSRARRGTNPFPL